MQLKLIILWIHKTFWGCWYVEARWKMRQRDDLTWQEKNVLNFVTMKSSIQSDLSQTNLSQIQIGQLELDITKSQSKTYYRVEVIEFINFWIIFCRWNHNLETPSKWSLLYNIIKSEVHDCICIFKQSA